MGKVIDDDNYMDLLISSLPPSYDSTCMSINVSMHLSLTNLTSDIFQQYILDKFELHMLKSKKKDTKDEAFATESPKKKLKKDIECHNCHK